MACFCANPCVHSAQNLNKLTAFRSFWNTIAVPKETLLGTPSSPTRASLPTVCRPPTRNVSGGVLRAQQRWVHPLALPQRGRRGRGYIGCGGTRR